MCAHPPIYSYTHVLLTAADVGGDGSGTAADVHGGCHGSHQGEIMDLQSTLPLSS